MGLGASMKITQNIRASLKMVFSMAKECALEMGNTVMVNFRMEI
jgi:hypothetical protein